MPVWNARFAIYITKHRPQETVKAQPVQSTEALVAAVAAPAPDKRGKFTSGLCGCCQHICTCCMAMWCCTDAIIFGQMYEKQDPEKRKGSCKQIVGYFYLLYIVMIVFSVLGYHVYGETSTLGYPLAGLSDAFYCLWVISFVAAIGYLRYVIRHKYEIPAQCCTCDQDGVVDDCCCAFWCPCCTTAQVARMVRRLDGRRRRRDAPLFAGHEYAIPATGTVKYDCTSATGEP